MSLGTCKLCGHWKKLAKAHIIPRSFFRKGLGRSKHWVEGRGNDTKPIQFWQNGISDSAILCEACDNALGQLDAYGFEVLGVPPGSNEHPKTDADVEPFVLKGIDYGRLKLFVLCVLWRASISGQPFFQDIKLGRHEATIAEMLRKRDPGPYDKFAVVLWRLVSQRVPNALLPPRRFRSPEGINFNVVYLPAMRIFVKVDQRPLPPKDEFAVLRPDRENLAVPARLFPGEVAALKVTAQRLQLKKSHG